MFMIMLNFAEKGEMFDIYKDKNNAGAIMVFYEPTKTESSKRDLWFMICDCKK